VGEAWAIWKTQLACASQWAATVFAGSKTTWLCQWNTHVRTRVRKVVRSATVHHENHVLYKWYINIEREGKENQCRLGAHLKHKQRLFTNRTCSVCAYLGFKGGRTENVAFHHMTCIYYHFGNSVYLIFWPKVTQPSMWAGRCTSTDRVNIEPYVANWTKLCLIFSVSVCDLPLAGLLPSFTNRTCSDCA
jgi:hypothetical protein